MARNVDRKALNLFIWMREYERKLRRRFKCFSIIKMNKLFQTEKGFTLDTEVSANIYTLEVKEQFVSEEVSEHIYTVLCSSFTVIHVSSHLISALKIDRTVKKCLRIEILPVKYMQIITCPKGYQ
jgi:hypothetical protein